MKIISLIASLACAASASAQQFEVQVQSGGKKKAAPHSEMKVIPLQDGGELPPELKVMLGIMERRAPVTVYLGVSTQPTAEATAAQLGIAKGMGMTVVHVAKDSPAQTAGLQPFDVLYKLDGQILINQPQLHVLLNARKVGDTVKMTYFRRGKEAEAQLTLAKPKKGGFIDDPKKLKDLGKLKADSFQELNMEQLQQMLKQQEKAQAELRPPNLNAVIELELEQLLNGEGGVELELLNGLVPEARVATIMGAIIRFQDSAGSYTLKKTKGGLHFNAKNVKGEQLFNGLIEPDAELKKVPADLRPQVDRLKALMGGVKLK